MLDNVTDFLISFLFFLVHYGSPFCFLGEEGLEERVYL